jgi:hydroxyacylglutathione hydrolase
VKDTIREESVIIEQIEVGDFAVFAYLLACRETGEAVVIDPAAEVKRILKVAKANGINAIKYIINTHSHADHAGGNREVKEATGAQIVIHRDDAERLANPPPFILEIFRCEASPPADRLVEDGDTIEFGKQSLKVIHTPGHTAGGICLYTPGYVITGDTLFVGAVGRTDLPGGSTRVLLQSIQARLLTLPEDTVVLPGHNYGHSPRSTIGQEKQFNPFLG